MRHCLLLCLAYMCLLPLAAHAQYVKDKTLRLEDAEYEPNIRTVLLVPNTGRLSDDMQYPLVALGAPNPLRLEFDEVGNQYHNYYYRILPCTWDWKPGLLQDMELADQINEYVMDGYALSEGTRVPYIHYYAQLPMLKLSGNYVVVVYREGNRDDIVLTRRFMVFETLTPIMLDPKFGPGADTRLTHQQIDAQVNYMAYPIVNPLNLAHLMIRQNGRWDNSIYNPPLNVREFDKILDYNYFALENAFEAGNEWRVFDIRNLRARGFNVAGMSYNNDNATAALALDLSRNIRTYSQYVDINGRYAIQRTDVGDYWQGSLTADYINVTFTVQPPPGLDLRQGKLYVCGQFTNYQQEERYRLQPTPDGRYLQVTVPLKQGLYSYQYGYVGPGARRFSFREMEGNYNQTENEYDAFFYYRPIGARYDQLAGYTSIQYNGRTR